MIIDSALYRAGGRVPVDCQPHDYAALRDAADGEDSFVWVGLHQPDAEEFAAVAAADGSGASSDEEQGSNAGSWAESDETASVDDGLDSPPAKYAKKMPAKEAADVSEPAAALSSVR